MKNKGGFTLAEVMVTLTALGVIAAILIPAITNLAPDRNIVLFRKAYYNLEQVVSQLINDEFHYPAGTSWAGGDCNVTVAGVPTPVDCGFSNTSLTTDIPATNNKFCYLLTHSVNVLNIQTQCTNAGKTAQFTSSDGTIWLLDESGGFPISETTPVTGGARITFDVNQKDTRNCGSGTYLTACTDNKTPDRYEVFVKYDGTLSVSGTEAQSYLSNPTKVTK